MPIAYLGSAFTDHPGGWGYAYKEIARIAAKLTRAGVHVFSPIINSWPQSQYGGISHTDLRIWYAVNETFMERCDTLIVARVEGWEKSKGLAGEIKYFERLGKPVFDLDCHSLKMVKRKAPEGVA